MTQLTIIGVFLLMIPRIRSSSRGKIRRRLPPYLPFSLCPEGLAVGALIYSGVCLMGADQNAVQRAEVGILAMMLALLNSTLNAFICMTIHIAFPPFLL